MPDEANQADQVQPENQGTESQGDDTQKYQSKVPYERFEKVVRQKQDYESKFDSMSGELEQIKQQLSNSTLKTSKEQDSQNLGKYDKLAREAKSWDDFVGAIKEDTISSLEKHQAEQIKKEEQAFDEEVKSLKKASGLESDKEIDKVIKFANEKSEELGKVLSLDMAYHWMKEAGQLEAEEKSEARKKASKKVKDSKRSSGISDDSNKSYEKLQHESIDDIVYRAKEQWNK